MNAHFSESVWLDDHDCCSAQQLVEVSGLSDEEFQELLEIGVIVAVDDTAKIKSFQLRYLNIANTACRLRDDFELNTHGVALAMTLVRHIEELKEELLATRARVSSAISYRGEHYS
jgi:chaperone modulatory protein CbpM